LSDSLSKPVASLITRPVVQMPRSMRRPML
jgi:hypothetical protein